MAKVLVVTSGKGGVGKTTSTAALGAALRADRPERSSSSTSTSGCATSTSCMGAERRVVYDLINVVQGVAKLPQALIRDKRVDTLSLLPASQTRDKDALTEEGVARVIKELREKFDWVICDSPPASSAAPRWRCASPTPPIIVTNPEVSSVRDSDRIIGLLDSKTERAEKGERIEKHLLITRYDPARAARGEMLNDRRRARHPVDPAARHHPGERGGAARLQRRLAGHAQRSDQRAGPRLYATRRAGCAAKRADDRSRTTARASSTSCSDGGRHEPIRMFQRRGSRAGRARAAANPARPRADQSRGNPTCWRILRDEILAVIAKHINVDRDKVRVKMERGDKVSTLEIDIEVPHAVIATAR